MNQFPIDVDAEAIFLDGAWYTREDLSRRIRAMLDSGDFNVARPSMALQELTQLMQGVRTLAFRVQPELGDALTQLATRLGQSVGAVIREAVTQYITDANSEPVQSSPSQAAAQQPIQLQQPKEQREVTVRAAIPMPVTGSTSEDLPKVIIDPPAPSSGSSQVIAGPGALRAAGVEREPAAPAESDQGEQRWFKQ